MTENQHDDQLDDQRAPDNNLNVVPLIRRDPPQDATSNPPREKLTNIPPITQYMLLGLIAVHLVLTFALTPPQQYWVFTHLGFVPGHYSGATPFNIWALAGPFSYMALHGNWMHLAMNGVMLTAFGAGVERWLGGRRLLILFIGCGLIAAATQYMLAPHSLVPVVGASGGLSGLFAAVLVMMNSARMRAGMGRTNMIPFVILWIGITILFGVMGGPDGSSVAWAAHIGGFLGGFVMLKGMRIV